MIVEGYNCYVKSSTPEQAADLCKVPTFLIHPPTPLRATEAAAPRELDATATWAVTPEVMELSETEKERRRVIADRRRGEDVTVPRIVGDPYLDDLLDRRPHADGRSR